ncbi:MAG TPA: methyltransferase domain-containing protein [Myxococcales bacterium]|nr:methyltransferase domain-containing protein [Myxococcales bacterium]
MAGALPGERVRVRVREEGRVLRGELLEVLVASSARRVPDACPLADRCGGCDWLNLDEDAQLAAKKEIVLSALEHLGGIPRTAYQARGIRAVAPAMGYRRRAVLHPGKEGLGYFGRRSHTHVQVDRCPALVRGAQGMPGELAQALQPILRDISEVHLLEAGGKTSFFVHLRRGLKARHRTAVEQAVKNSKARGAVILSFDGNRQTVGDPVLREDAPMAPNVSLRLRPDCFAQAHAGANHALVKAVLELSALTGKERLLELFCGNGNLTFALAGASADVVAVEAQVVSLDLACAAAGEAKVTNVRFVLGNAGKVVPRMAKCGERFDVLVADPPRTGAAGIAAWAEVLEVKRVVYVACDPGALARDARELNARGFRPKALELVELFPQTHHVEAVMSFERASEKA